jgi:hypothetical protein
MYLLFMAFLTTLAAAENLLAYIALFIYLFIYSFAASLTHCEHLSLLFIYDLFNTFSTSEIICAEI